MLVYCFARSSHQRYSKYTIVSRGNMKLEYIPKSKMESWLLYTRALQVEHRLHIRVGKNYIIINYSIYFHAINNCTQSEREINYCNQSEQEINYCNQFEQEINYCNQFEQEINYCNQFEQEINGPWLLVVVLFLTSLFS